MNNFERVRDMFNDMHVFLNGKRTVGIVALQEKYPDDPLLAAFLGKLDKAIKVPFNEVMLDCFSFYKRYTGGPYTPEYWERVVKELQTYNQKWNDNAWSRGLILALLELLELESSGEVQNESIEGTEAEEETFQDEEQEMPIAA